jgi:hypothetical protein
MNTMMFYLGALVLCGLSALLIRERPNYSRSAAPTSERKRTQRLLGRILLGFAVFFTGMGVLTQFLSSYH